MRRVVLVLGIGWLVILCAGGAWLASRPSIQSLLPPDATDIHMAANGWGEWTLSYQTLGQPYGWYATVGHQLQANGWVRSGEQYVGGPLYDPPTYTRKTSLGLVVLWERVELDGEAHGAHLGIYRWIAIQP